MLDRDQSEARTHLRTGYCLGSMRNRDTRWPTVKYGALTVLPPSVYRAVRATWHAVKNRVRPTE
jgi:hypothetical protein